MKKLFVLAIIILFVAGSIPVFAGGGPKTAFQAVADPIKAFTGRAASPDRYESKGIFQTIANNILRIGTKTRRSGPPPKNVLQSTADGLSEFESWIKGKESTYTGTPSGLFQELKNFIEENVKPSPVTRAQSLRGREDEIARRRGLITTR